MLSERLTELLKHEAGEIMKAPRLLMEMLSLYSKIFLNDQPCSTCEKLHKEYIARLHREGHKTIQKITVMESTKTKYKFKIEGTLIHTPYGIYSQANLTDSDVEVICKDFPRFRNQFINPPPVIDAEEVEAPKTVETVIPKPVRKPRKK